MIDRQGRIEDLLYEALQLDLDARKPFIEHACGSDLALRNEVESLLSAHRNADQFLQAPILGHPDDDDAEQTGPAAAPLNARLGPYRIESVLATGGMGTVYLATRADGAYEQRVAVKTVAAHVATPTLRRRFELERRTLARLEHPYIARLLDGGTTPDRLPYLVMEYIEGRPIDTFCHEMALNVRQRLALFLRVCEAVQYAHQRLIVHRDLKPGNILVTDAGIPKLLDFGIATLLEEETRHQGGDRTLTLIRAMTPHYASPEQVRRETITTASDVYSLGVVLYELLTETRPYDLAHRSDWERIQVVCEEEPPLPSAAVVKSGAAADSRSALVRAMRGDLDNIVMKALRKNPARRYASVDQFADDVRRYLDGHTVSAQADSVFYRYSKWIRRHKTVSVVSAGMVLALLLGTAGTTVGLVRARRAAADALIQRNAAMDARDQAEKATRFLQETILSTNPFRQGRPIGVLELLEEADRRIQTELADEPEVEAEVRYAIGSTYAGMWMWPEAVGQLEAALDLYRRTKGVNDPDVAKCLSVLGRGLTFARDPRAVDVQREGLRIRLEHLGPGHPLVAESTGNLGYALWHCPPPRWAEAERCYLDALDIYRAHGNHRHRDYARFAFSLGVMYTGQDRPDNAEPRFREALDIYRELSGSEDRYMVECLIRYAHLLESMDRHEEAVQLRKEAEARTPDTVPDSVTSGR